MASSVRNLFRNALSQTTRQGIKNFLTPNDSVGQYFNQFYSIPVAHASGGFGPNTAPNGVSNAMAPNTPATQYGPVDPAKGFNNSVFYQDPNMPHGNTVASLPAVTGSPSSAERQGTAGPGRTATSTVAPNTSSVTTTPNIMYFQGQAYDVNNPDQRNAFFNARNSYLDTQANQQFSQYATPVQQSLEQGARTNTEALAGINRDVGNLTDQYDVYNRGYTGDVNNLNQNYDLGAVNRQNSFAQASPNAFQSSQGSGEQYAMHQRDRALGDMAQNKSLTDKNYAQQQAGLEQERGDLGYNYNLFTKNAQDALTNYKTLLSNYYGGQKDQLSTDAAQYAGPNPDVGAFNYNRGNVSPLNAVNTDISQYTPAINFQALARTPGANYFGSFNPSVGSQNRNPLDQYLGSASTPQDQEYINRYLSGKLATVGA